MSGSPLHLVPAPAVAVVTRRLARAGWSVREGFELADDPWDVTAQRVLLTGRVQDADTAAAVVLAAARGAGVLVITEPAPSGDVLADLLADLRRIGPVTVGPGGGSGSDPGGDPGRDGDVGARSDGPPLTPEQCALLDRLAAGESIAAAAEAEFLSLRTANRRISAARAALGATSTRAAVLAYVRRRALP